MDLHDDKSARCCVHEAAIGFARRAGVIVDSDGGSKTVDSVRQLMAMGLSIEEIEDLDIRQPMLQAMCEYARLDRNDGGRSERASEAVGATLRAVEDEVRKLDMEMEMLNLRKRALLRRTQALGKLASFLEASESDLLAA